MKVAKRQKWFIPLNVKKINFNNALATFITPTIFMCLMTFQFLQHLISLNELLMGISVGVLLGFLLRIEVNNHSKWSGQDTITFTFLSSGLLLTMYAIQVISLDLPILFYMTPIAAFAILNKHFITERFALISSVISAAYGSFIFMTTDFSMYQLFIYLLLSQWFAVFMFESIKDRKTLFKTAASLLSVHLILIIIFELRTWHTWTVMTPEFMLSIVFSMVSVLLAVILTLGILPLFEAGFNMLTESKLLTLSNPNHPLLRKVLVEAPGTYHHSVMVANLSESACESIGANGLLARVAAYYHDVGKALKPHMFIENQNGKNPHDSLPPEDSARIILQHPNDGASLLKEYGLPQEIIDIAQQHHGTTLLKYFYYKAKERNSNVSESTFRYDGPIPQSKEAAIINICDSVEAAVRSKKHPTNEEINKIVRSIIYDRLLDGQFNDCHLTIDEILTIENNICDMLNGIFHQRIEYPKEQVMQTTSGGH